LSKEPRLTDLATAKRLEAEYASSVVHGRGVNPAFYHPRTHNIPVAVLHFRSFTPKLLDLFTHFATHAASSLAIPVSRPVYLPTQRSLWTVPKGPFAHKKSQENFERKVHKRAIKAWDADDEVVGFWLKYLRQHMLAGVGMRSTIWQRVPVGIGQKTLKEAMDRLRMSTPLTDAERVKALGDKIVSTELAAADTVVPSLPHRS
jgi:small subunit ribosomal protein S10